MPFVAAASAVAEIEKETRERDRDERRGERRGRKRERGAIFQSSLLPVVMQSFLFTLVPAERSLILDVAASRACCPRFNPIRYSALFPRTRFSAPSLLRSLAIGGTIMRTRRVFFGTAIVRCALSLAGEEMGNGTGRRREAFNKARPGRVNE